MEVVSINHERGKKRTTEEHNASATEEESHPYFKFNGVIPQSLLTLLDDKNKSISILKRQIHNQKMQLGYYLHRELRSHKVAGLAVTCLPDEAQENLKVNLAMVKFHKKTGLKSKIMDLHERMKHVEVRTLRILEQQEDMVKRIINRLSELSHNKCITGGMVQFVLFNMKGSTEVDILAKIVGSTNKLRKELDTYRTCCSRLIVIEDERNTLVEQVYAMPVTQRMSYGMLLSAQYEKLRLEKEVRAIRRDQRVLQQRLSTFDQADVAETDTAGDQSEVHRMLKVVNAEAVSLMTTAKSHREKYLDEISKLSEINVDLSRQVRDLQEAVKYKETTKEKIEELLSQHEVKFKEFYAKMNLVTEENEELRRKLDQYADIEEQVKFLRTQINDMEAVRRQRDYYKAQVNDLQAIRAAYAQLVEQPRDDNEKIVEQTKKIEDLENYQHQMELQKRNMEGLITDQEFQIQHLLVIIEKLAQCSDNQSQGPDELPPEKPASKTAFKSYVSPARRNVQSQTDNAEQFRTILEEFQSSPSATFTSGAVRNRKVLISTEDKAIMCSLVQNESETVCDISNSEMPLDSQSDKNNASSWSSGNFPTVSTTSVHVQTVNRKGKSESLKAIVESSSPVEGLLQVNNSSAITLRLTCGSFSDTENDTQSKSFEISSNSPLPTIVSGQELKCISKIGESEVNCPVIRLDEFELMRDSSNETVPATLPSLHRQMGDIFNIPTTEIELNSSVGILHKIQDESKVEDSDDSELSSNFSEVKMESRSAKSGDVTITSRLKQITYCLDQTLSQPGGKELLLKSVRTMFNSTFQGSKTQ